MFLVFILFGSELSYLGNHDTRPPPVGIRLGVAHLSMALLHTILDSAWAASNLLSSSPDGVQSL